MLNKFIENKLISSCPKCNTILIIKHTQFLNDYCPKCKCGLVYVINTETGKGKQIFFKVIKKLEKEKMEEEIELEELKFMMDESTDKELQEAIDGYFDEKGKENKEI